MMEDKPLALLWIADKLQIPEITKKETIEEQQEVFAAYLDHLIIHDYHRLIGILYRLDVQEEKAKTALALATSEFSDGQILAQLIIQREIEKLQFRKKYRAQQKGDSPAEPKKIS